MCGILGAVNFTVIDSLKEIKHRGPDFQDSIDFKTEHHLISLGHTRLSIIDLSETGNQPMSSEDDNYYIIFNGEIYNHIELRGKLTQKKFKGHSDTETILYYLIEFGVESVVDFNGIFSFAFFDKKSNRIFLARDPFGVKPLYYYCFNNKLIFSSEIRPIHHLGVKKEINRSLISTFLRLRYLPAPYTLFQNINKLKPGEIITVDLENKHFSLNKKTFSKVPSVNNEISFKDALDEYECKLQKAVNRQLMSDVPISHLLSGGVDSALIAKLVKCDSGYDITCFTAGYNIKSDIDEMDDAVNTVRHLGLKHKKVILSEQEFLQKLPELIDIIEEPVGSQSIFPIFYLTETIHKNNFKVALSGQGVDEPMGGYKKYRAQNFIENIKRIPLSSEIGKKLSNTKNDDLRRIFRSISSDNKINQIKESVSFFDEGMLNQLLNVKESINQDISANIISNRIDEYDITNKNITEIMMNLDARMNLSDDLLLYTDKISMKNSLELRVPFLDLELVRFVESLPSRYKVNFRNNKILHKKLSERHLPKEIVERKKKGFYTPRKIWFRGEFGNHFLGEIKNDEGLFSELLNKEYILKLFDNHRKGKANFEKQLYLIIVFYLWIKTNFKK